VEENGGGNFSRGRGGLACEKRDVKTCCQKLLVRMLFLHSRVLQIRCKLWIKESERLGSAGRLPKRGAHRKEGRQKHRILGRKDVGLLKISRKTFLSNGVLDELMDAQL